MDIGMRNFGEDGINVLACASGDSHPCWASSDSVKEMVVPKESNQGYCWEFQGSFLWASTPDRGSHWNEIVIFEGIRVILFIQVFADTLLPRL